MSQSQEVLEGGLQKGKWIRIECQNNVPYHPNNTTDVAGQTSESYSDLIKEAERDGWKKIKGKWYCPDCTVHQPPK